VLQAVRVEESREQLCHLRSEFRGWLSRRRKADENKQYDSQLEAIGKVTEAAVAAIQGGLDEISSGATRGEVYDACRAADGQMVFVDRLWGYYREKWDQRDDAALGPLLAAADEVVWSCYVPPFRCLEQDPGPPPLPYVAADFSAHAVTRADLPRKLRPTDQLLHRTLRELPVPIIGLPRICVARPWWLAVIAHEVGHHVADCLDGGALIPRVSELLGKVSSGNGPLGWEAWAHEVFADAYSVALLGGVHLWLLAELEPQAGAGALRSSFGYPPPLVRLSLAEALMETLGLSRDRALPQAPAVPPVDSVQAEDADRRRAAGLLATVPGVARALADKPLAGGAKLPDLTDWKASQLTDREAAGWWQKQFGGAAPVSGEADVVAARMATVGAVAEWAEIAAEPRADERQEGMARLRERVLQVLPECHEVGRRGPTGRGLDVEDLSQWIAGEVRRISPEDVASAASVDPSGHATVEV